MIYKKVTREDILECERETGDRIQNSDRILRLVYEFTFAILFDELKDFNSYASTFLSAMLDRD